MQSTMVILSLHDILFYLALYVASPLSFALVILGLSLLLLLKHEVRSAAFLVAGAALTSLTVFALKTSLRAPRPDRAIIEITGYGMPSAHAAGAAFLALGIYLVFRNRMQLRARLIFAGLLILLAWLVGASRVYLGVHNELQVLAGFATGVIVAYGLYALMRPWTTTAENRRM